MYLCVFLTIYSKIATHMASGKTSTSAYLHIFRPSEICGDFIFKHIHSTSTQHVICSICENTFLWGNENFLMSNLHSSFT